MNKENFVLASLGYLVLTDLIVFILISLYIKNKFNLPDYIVIIGVLLGLLTSTFRFCKVVLKGMKND